jgi:hypothetical protein
MRNPDRDRRATPAELPSDELIMAAVERSVRHRAGDVSDVPVWAILEHLGLATRSREARHVRSRLNALQAAGSLLRARRHGVPVWALTTRGRQRLENALSAGEAPRLPESPQHREWRRARTAGAEEIERFRRSLADTVDEATRLLDADPHAHSDKWFELAERLRRATWRVGSAGHCLYEWAEPDDAVADIDDHSEPGEERIAATERAARRARRAGRRNIRLWRSAGGVAPGRRMPSAGRGRAAPPSAP